MTIASPRRAARGGNDRGDDRQGGANHRRDDDGFSECRACCFEQRRTRPF